MILSGKIWKKSGTDGPGYGYNITNGYIVGPLLPVSRAFPGVLVCVYTTREKLPAAGLLRPQAPAYEKTGPE